MDDHEARLRELGSTAFEGTPSDAEFAGLAQLSRAMQKLRAVRVQALAAPTKEQINLGHVLRAIKIRQTPVTGSRSRA